MTDAAYKDRIRDFYDLVSPYFRELWGEHLHGGYYESGAETKEEAQDKLVAYLASAAGIPRGARGRLDAIALLKAIRGIRTAMARGLIGCGVVVAERLPPTRPPCSS